MNETAPPSTIGPPAFGREAFSGTVIDRWLAVVEAQPDAIAIGGTGDDRTYAQLNARADAVAGMLSTGPGVRLGEPVAVLAGQDAAAISASFGVWKAGGAVVVLDPTLPDAKLRALVVASGATACVAAADLIERGRQAGLTRLVNLAVVGDVPAAKPLAAQSGPLTLAQIVFTSGSTGTPKGVTYSHRTLLHDAWTRGAVGWISPGYVIAQPLPLAFAAGFHDTLGALLAGAQVQLRDPRSGGISEFGEWLQQCGATGLIGTPSLLLALAGNLADGQTLPGSLRLVRSTGEKFLARDAQRVLARLPSGCGFVNVLGSSETGLLASYPITADSSDGTRPLPVGWPLPDKDIHLVADDLGDGEDPARLAPSVNRIEGRMLVRSGFTASSYLNDPQQTAQVFLANPDGDGLTVVTSDLMRRHPDGRLELLGRRDHTVKVRGYRVDPGEVEAALLTCSEVAEAVVVGQERPGRGTRLVAYVSFHRGKDVGAAHLRRQLRPRLPNYLVPECVVPLTQLPRNERGKIDRAALPAPRERSTAYAAPVTQWEELLATLWQEVLDLDQVGAADDFFELGGDSLAAEELIARLERDFGVRVTTQTLLAAPTLSGFAARAKRAEDGVHPTLIPVQPGGDRPALFVVAGGGAVGLGFLPLARRLPKDQPVWGLQAKGVEAKRSIPDWTVRRSAARHVEALRSVQPHGPYYLAGHSFGGLVAFEMAQQLHHAGEEVALLVIIDSFAPDPTLVPGLPLNGVVARLKNLAALALTGIIPTPGHGHYLRFHRQSGALARRYKGRPWAGPTLVIAAQDAGMAGRAQEWGRFLRGSWSLESLPGNHEAIIREPYVAAVADLIEAALLEHRGPSTREPLVPSARKAFRLGSVKPG